MRYIHKFDIFWLPSLLQVADSDTSSLYFDYLKNVENQRYYFLIYISVKSLNLLSTINVHPVSDANYF